MKQKKLKKLLVELEKARAEFLTSNHETTKLEKVYKDLKSELLGTLNELDINGAESDSLKVVKSRHEYPVVLNKKKLFKWAIKHDYWDMLPNGLSLESWRHLKVTEDIPYTETNEIVRLNISKKVQK